MLHVPVSTPLIFFTSSLPAIMGQMNFSRNFSSNLSAIRNLESEIRNSKFMETKGNPQYNNIASQSAIRNAPKNALIWHWGEEL